MAFDLLTGPSSFVGSTFDPVATRNLLNDHVKGERNEQTRLWPLLSLEVWHRELVRRTSSPLTCAKAQTGKSDAINAVPTGLVQRCCLTSTGQGK